MNTHPYLAAAATAILFLGGPSAVNAQGLFGGLFGIRSSESEIRTQADQLASQLPQPLRPLLRKLYVEGEWNAVLNANQLGLAAMSLGHFEMAEQVFDDAIARIQAVYADESNAQAARRYWNEEKVKDFKGEPHERAMSFFYRGLLYARKGDYQNARASFLSADYQDTLSATESYQGDFALMNFLASWASHCDKDGPRAQELQRRLQTVESGGGKGPFLSTIADSPDLPNMIALVDLGRAPLKAGEGQHREKLTFQPVNPAFTPVGVQWLLPPEGDFRRLAQGVAGDVEFQAMTRGGRQVDAVLGEKAQFKDEMSSAGGAMAEGAVAMARASLSSNNRDLGAAAGLFSLLSLGATIASAMTTPAADTRSWMSLPKVVSADAVVAAIPPTERLKLKVGEAELLPILFASDAQCAIAWTPGDVPPLPREFGGDLDVETVVLQEGNRAEKNKLFRDQLTQRFQGGQQP